MTVYIKHAFLISFILAAINGGRSQGNSVIEDILKTAFSSNAVQFQYEKCYQLQQLDYNIPFIEKIEVRSETNNFDYKQQDISIRVSPNTGKSRRSHRLYHESVQHMTEMEYATEIMKALTDRYQMIIDLAFAKEMLRVESIRKVVALDKVKLLKRMISLSSFDIVELIEAEDEVYQLQRKLQSIESLMDNLTTQLSELTSAEKVDINRKDLISVKQIKLLLEEKLLDRGKNHPEAEVLSARHYNSMMEHEWESAQNAFSIGFIQAKYGYNPDKSFGNNFSLGIGFNFPVKGSSRLDLNELKVTILDTQSKYLQLKNQITQDQMANGAKLKSLISMHDLLEIQIQEGNANHALIEYSKQGFASPRALLKLKELSINNEALLLEIESEIAKIYLAYIYSTGALGETPYKNYLDFNLPILK